MAKKSSKKQVGFKLEAPEATEVFLVGDFNDWDTAARAMKKGARGIWRTRIGLEPGVHQYRFFVDGEWVSDPDCEECCDNDHGTRNCVVRV